ncbi:MAG: hypothetical protein LBL09_01470 [Oscillospiraceae bacterium]|jgi:hypothetical protein|nr:hypothetical protein [Oscillospiraceae bacterium]
MEKINSYFIVEVLNRQNSSLQGMLSNMDTDEVQPYRSVMELIHLIDSGIEAKISKKPGGGGDRDQDMETHG